MPNNISPALMAQLLAQESGDPFLVLLTLTHSSFAAPYRLVNNSEDITSGGNLFKSFPFKITLPPDDGQSARAASLTLDNVSLELTEAIRTVTTRIDVKLEMILASIPNDIQMSIEELKIGQITYNRESMVANLVMDDFLQVGLSSEVYSPSNFPGIF